MNWQLSNLLSKAQRRVIMLFVNRGGGVATLKEANQRSRVNNWTCVLNT